MKCVFFFLFYSSASKRASVSFLCVCSVLRFIQSSVDYVGFTTKADRVAFQEELQSIVGLERHKMPKCRVKFVVRGPCRPADMVANALSRSVGDV